MHPSTQLILFLSLLLCKVGAHPQSVENLKVENNVDELVNDSSETIIVIRKKNGEVVKYSSKEGGIPSEVLARIDNAEEDSSSSTSTTPATTTSGGVTLRDPGLDARTEIANYNRFMDEIFARMNSAIMQKKLDPMDLKLLSRDHEEKNRKRIKKRKEEKEKREKEKKEQEEKEKEDEKTAGPLLFSKPNKPVLIFTDPSSTTTTTTTTTEKPTTKKPPIISAVVDEDYDYEEEEDVDNEIAKVRGWLYGMSSLKRQGDVSIFIHESHRTIQCPFALGPLELKVSKTLDNKAGTKRTKSATATTDLMLGLMDLKIDRESGAAEISNVMFDEPGGVDVNGSLKRRSELLGGKIGGDDSKIPPYRLVLASRAALGIKKVARLVVSQPLKGKAMEQH